MVIGGDKPAFFDLKSVEYYGTGIYQFLLSKGGFGSTKIRS